MCLTVACSYTLGGRADDDGDEDEGSGGSSTLDLIDDPEDLFAVMEDDDDVSREVPFISHVRGGPETLIEFCCARPIVPGRPACRTVPKSQRSSTSAFAGLERILSLERVNNESRDDLQFLVNHLLLFLYAISTFGLPSLVPLDQF